MAFLATSWRKSPGPSRGVVSLVVWLRRQALALADALHDVVLQFRGYRLEARVLCRPQYAALRRAADRGREPEHRRHGDLGGDPRRLAFPRDVLDHAAPRLHVADRRAHHILRDVHEQLPDWFHGD